MSTLQALPPTTDDALLDNLSTADILRFGRTSKSAHHALQSYLRRRYRLSHVLAPFFTEDQTEGLRTLMSRTGMIISGSIALQFMDRTIYPGSDLDLYAPLKYAWQISDWLVSAGYTYTPLKASLPTVDIALRTAADNLETNHTWNMPPTNRGYLRATCVMNFTASDPPRKIQLMSTLRSTIELILSFHSTCVMNLITHDKAYCLFPRATLEERRALTYLSPSTGSEAKKSSYHKYTGRGWELLNSITRDEFDNPYSSFARGTRFIGDGKCWTVPVLPLRRDLPESTVDINSFALEYDEELEPVFTFRHIDVNGLQQPYVLLEEDAHYMKENFTFPRMRHRPEDREVAMYVDDRMGEEDQAEECMNEAEDGDNMGHGTENSYNGGESTLDHNLKLFLAKIRDMDGDFLGGSQG
ncbi:hypothetical protein D9619_012541 [Psilocybe cf. subviscida]|uniref:F-box domain-containing protein n=1 Tax=Psilocybe cf. subviscida TaxID=2480587 RepID=A0A8H5B6X6_9AGAR|nr:hypothetical protein D9619_012541 [Psilocybe cf. subviscida]